MSLELQEELMMAARETPLLPGALDDELVSILKGRLAVTRSDSLPSQMGEERGGCEGP